MDSLEDQLNEAGRLIGELRESVPMEIEPEFLSHDSPFPLRLTMSAGGHLNRVLDLAESSLALVKDHRPLPAIVVARACLESAAVLAELADRAEQFVVDGNHESFNGFLEKVALGSKNDDTPFEATNVLTYMDKLERKFPGTKAFYADLCEQAHPNWAATAPYLNLGTSNVPQFRKPGKDFELMVPAPVLVASKISIDAAERLHAVVKKLTADA